MDKNKKTLFGERLHLTRQQFRSSLRKASGRVPGGGIFSKKDRTSIEEGLFPKEKFGWHITPYEMRRRLKQLKREAFRSRGTTEGLKTKRQIRFLESLKGKK